MALSKQLLCAVIARTWALVAGLNSVAISFAMMGSGTEQAVAVISDCKDVLKAFRTNVLHLTLSLHDVKHAMFKDVWVWLCCLR